MLSKFRLLLTPKPCASRQRRGWGRLQGSVWPFPGLVCGRPLAHGGCGPQRPGCRDPAGQGSHLPTPSFSPNPEGLGSAGRCLWAWEHKDHRGRKGTSAGCGPTEPRRQDGRLTRPSGPFWCPSDAGVARGAGGQGGFQGVGAGGGAWGPGTQGGLPSAGKACCGRRGGSAPLKVKAREWLPHLKRG